jgi:hypothetical protein
MTHRWAVPKRFDEPGLHRLAIATEARDLALGDFEGEIPASERGAGLIERWGDGRYAPDEPSGAEAIFRLSSNTNTGGTDCCGCVANSNGAGYYWGNNLVAH